MLKRTIEILTAIGLVIPVLCDLLKKIDEALRDVNRARLQAKEKVRSTTIE